MNVIQNKPFIQVGCWLALALVGTTAFAADTKPSPPKVDGFRIGMTTAKQSRSDYVFLIRQSDSGWTVISDGNINDESTERVGVDLRDQQVVLLLDHMENNTICKGDSSSNRGTKGYNGYDLCGSAFSTTDVGTTAYANTATLGFGLVVGALTGSFSRFVQFDHDSFARAISESGVIELAKKKRSEDNLGNYRKAFAEARSSKQLDNFITMYRDNDPDNLLPQARALREEAAAKEMKERKHREAEELARVEERRREEEVSRRRQAATTEAFRKAIKVESETNCGPVIEIKGSLVKVYFPVASYGNEHWIKKDQIFPPGFECRFLNGNYMPLSL